MPDPNEAIKIAKEPRPDKGPLYVAPDPARRIAQLERESARLRAALKRTIQGYENLIEVGALPNSEWDKEAQLIVDELRGVLDKARGES